MTSPTTAASRGSGLSADELAALKPHVVDLHRGMLATGPDGEGEYFTTAQDVQDIFGTHLPAFLEGRSGPTPLMVNAHGGLVTEASGLRAAEQRIPWWKDNGIYPIFFVWETGLVPSLADALAGWLSGSRGPGDFKDRIVELAARFGQGERVWGEMKRYAELASSEAGGARFFADQLGSFVRAHPDALSIHAVGHSAGSIFHSHFLPVLLDNRGVDRIESVSLLAPAVRTDTFKDKLVPLLDSGIGKMAMFTMTDDLERADNCVRVYGKSLLYLVRASFEPRVGDPILGLQASVEADPVLAEFFGDPDSGSSAEVVWSTADTGPSSSSDARSHGAFDDDPATMESVMRRILGGRKDIRPMPATRGAESLWPAQPRDVPVPTWPNAATRKALCVGINLYEQPQDQLNGCVADAGAWATELEKAGFQVHSLTDGAATREGILLKMLELVATSSPGDTLVVQYAGHGTTAPDLDGDEAAPGQGKNQEDEALCPVDFRSGELIIDDDLGAIWDQLPEGVALTLFFDSCHSGDGQREVLSPAELAEATMERRLPRRVVLSDEERKAFMTRRGYTGSGAALGRGAAPSGPDAGPAAQPQASNAVDRYKAAREVLFSACQPDELAYETAGHGDFTAKAAPLLAAAIGTMTNQAFLDKVAADFGGRQHPKANGQAARLGLTFLGPESHDGAGSGGAGKGAAGKGAAAMSAPPASAATQQAGQRADDAEVAALESTLAQAQGAAGHRAAKVARLLRAIADVIEE
ncbi:hypothetical protein GCM10012320_07520 [Sinomonas cellulolyticus]|uniref:Caspase family protein n=1 Tax=Sinomonas cellulolyticus TaxID=2801916 RepID=A0ABS1K5B8_9MICC|nr:MULTISPECIES: caspase family protein [Sinomonas]MBL0706077.1 caspase family protein [Sinomonas cellulolyticus]GHG43369.1 hypothetical protein GCM10012320_07520 [Sinomonas sp. KCTC 49339]